MPFQLMKVREEDCAAVAAMDEVATRGWPLGKAMDIEAERQGKTRRQLIEGLMLQHFKDPNPNSLVIKIVDSESGALAAVAQWSWQLKEMEEKVKVDAPVPEEGAVPQAKEERQSLFSYLRAESEGARMESYGNSPHFRLQFLITHPDWRRQGAGSMLIDHGCRMADEAGLISVLTASAIAWRLYERHGFKVFKYHDLDLRPFGVDESEPRRFMLRQPQAKNP